MKLSETLNRDYIAAMKSRNQVQLTVLRLLKTAISNRLVELKRPGGQLEDEELLDLLLKQAKQRKDSIEQFKAARRDDLADKEEQELHVLESYLPKQLDDEELKEIITNVIRELGASGPQAMGKVTGAVMSRYKGQVDGKKTSAMIKQLLSSQ